MCQGTEFKTVINFGKNSLVNSLLEKKDLDKKEALFPLIVRQCQTCWLVQLTEVIDPYEIYKDVNYLYFSGDMPGLKEYFKDYADDLKARFLDDKDDFVLEIGSNDGLMLNFFRDNHTTLGIDPSSNVVVRALKKGIPTISDFFSERLAIGVTREFGKAKVVYGNNCIAHFNDLHDVMRGVTELLTDDGVLALECNYWGAMVKNKNYSLIYHDHFSYFSLQTWINFAKKFGLRVFDAIVTPSQGGSLRLFIDRRKKEVTDRCLQLSEEETMTNLNSYGSCIRYRKEILAEARKLGNLVRQFKREGKRISGYGAAAKGFSILKLADIDQRHIDYFVDDSPAKQGKFTPVSHIPVISRQEANEKLPDYFLITAPNYADVIVIKEHKYRESGGKFILVDSRII
jgi:hypothetical protein